MNILLIHSGWMLPWSKIWASNFKEIGHNPYYLVPFKPTENMNFLLDGSTVYNHFMHPVPNIEPFDNLLDQYDIDVVIFNGCFTYQERGMYNCIQARNMFIKKGNMNKKPIDTIVTEIGFVRDINVQCDTVGACCCCSYSYDSKRKKTILGPEETQKWNLFVQKYKNHKLKGIKEYSRKEICSILGIQENKQIIFCPLQIPRDSLLLFQTRWCHSMVEYLFACKYLFDDKEKYHIVFKQHPYFKQLGNDKFVNLAVEEIKSIENSNISFLDGDHEINTPSFLLNSDCMATVNSSAGMEALILDRPVISLGFNAWTPAAIWWNNIGQKDKYNEHIAKFNDEDTKLQRISFLYNLMFNYSVTFTNEFDFQEVIAFINKKLVYYQL